MFVGASCVLGAWFMDDPWLCHDGNTHRKWLTHSLLDLVLIPMFHSSLED